MNHKIILNFIRLIPGFLIGVIYSIPMPLNICSGGITEQLNNDLIFVESSLFMIING